MPVLYPTELQIDGPWLIDEPALRSLDGLFDIYEKRFKEISEARVNETIEKEIDAWKKEKAKTEEAIKEHRKYLLSTERWRLKSERRLVVFLKGGRTVPTTSFQEAIKHPLSQEDVPTGFKYTLRAGSDLEANVEVPRISVDSPLAISTGPQAEPAAQEFFASLQNWTQDQKPAPWKQRWMRSGDLVRMLTMMWVVMFGVFWLVTSLDSPKAATRADAHKLVEQGIKPGEEREALRQILILTSEYSTYPVIYYRPGLQYWSALLIGAALLIALNIYPQVEIGLWGGKRRIKRWHAWTTALWISIPGSIATWVVVPKLLKLGGLG